MSRTGEVDEIELGFSRGIFLSTLGGLATGTFASWGYYSDTFRPLSHTFALWVILVALLAARRSMREAVVRGVVGLSSAVVAFYLGKKFFYEVNYPGMPYDLNPKNFLLWIPASVVAGLVLGGVFHYLGARFLKGAIALGAFFGLLIADVTRRVYAYPSEAAILITVALLGGVLVTAYSARSVRQLGQAAIIAVPMTVLSVGLVILPDMIEQLLV